MTGNLEQPGGAGRRDDRVWPLLLRAGGMSVHPGRVLLGMLTCLVLLGVGTAFDRIWGAFDSAAPRRFGDWIYAWRTLLYTGVPVDGRGVVWRHFGSVPVDISRLLLWALLAAASSVGIGAIARMVAVDIAADADMSARHALRFALARAFSFIVAAALPVVLILCVVLLLGVAGVLLLSTPWVSVLGALLFGVAIVIGVATAGLWLAVVIGGGMIVPAVACESTDAVDAIQRCIAYVYKRMGHALLYLAILAGAWLVASIAIRVIVFGGLELAESAASKWLGDGRTLHALASKPDDNATGTIIMVWRWGVELVISGWMLSYAATGGTLMYLALRRVCDDQDQRDLWMEAGRYTPVMSSTPAASPDADESDQDDLS